MKLTHAMDKYVTMIDGNAVLKPEQESAHQSLSYNVQGELITSGKCLTYLDENYPVFYGPCAGDKKQKWHIFDNKISPQHDNHKCLTVKDNSLYIKQCNESNDKQNWTVENTNIINSSWDKYHGKTVVLVESNNPWYINNDTTDVMENKYKENMLPNKIGFKKYADYKTNFVINANGPHMGYGVSYADRTGVPCDKIEQFDEGVLDNNNQIICIMLCVLFIIIIYKIWKMRNDIE
jgi:Ricin-type beta-trefoil lectin domain.